MGALLESHECGHGRLDAVFSSDVIASSEHAAGAAPSYRDRLLAKLRSIAGLDSCVEAVHVQMYDFPFHFPSSQPSLFDGHAHASWLDETTMANPLSKAKLSSLRKLQSKKYRETEGKFLIEGWHLLDEAIKANIALRTVVFEDGRALSESDASIRESAVRSSPEIYTAQESQVKALSETRTSPGVVSVVDCLPDSLESIIGGAGTGDRGFIVALDGVSDPGNCGSIVRACDWFGVDAVLFGEACSEIENGKLVRATMGGLFHLPLARTSRLSTELGRLKTKGYRIVASSLGDSVSLDAFQWPGKTVLVIGNEARGVSEEILEHSDFRVRIPGYGKGESLNAAMAASVMLGHWRI